MPLTPEYLSTIVAVGTSVLGSVMAYGAMKARLERLEKDMERLAGSFVQNDMFRIHVQKIEQDLTEIKKDIRALLMEGRQQEQERD